MNNRYIVCSKEQTGGREIVMLSSDDDAASMLSISGVIKVKRV